MSDRTAGRLARALFALEALLLISVLLGVVVLRERTGDALLTLGMFTFPAVGVVVARHQPRNAVAWVLLGIGFAWCFSAAVDLFGTIAAGVPALAASRPYAALISDWAWVPGLGPIGTFLILLFPDGHLPTPRWRAWAWFSGVALLIPAVLILFSPGPVGPQDAGMTNPLGLSVLGEGLEIATASVLLIPVAIGGCAVALVRRYRRSRGIQRLQLKWLAFAASIMAVVYLVVMIASIPYNWTQDGTPAWLTILQNLSLVTFVLVPIAVGISITRYRLYDIDRLINRALVYGAVSAVLIVVYVLGVIGAGAALRTITGSEQGNLAVAGSTLAVAALFRPFRARVQRFIDRRFYRQRYNAARTIEAFSARLRHETDLQTLTAELSNVVSETVQPARVALWIASRA